MLHRLYVDSLGRTYLGSHNELSRVESFLEPAHLGPLSYSRHTYLLPVSLLKRKNQIHDSRSEDSVVVFGRMVSSHAIKPPLTLQPVVDDRPGALASVANLTHSLVGSTARAIEEPFVAQGHRTDSACVGQDALPALHADLGIAPGWPLLSHEKSVEGRHHGFLELRGSGLDAKCARHNQHGIGSTKGILKGVFYLRGHFVASCGWNRGPGDDLAGIGQFPRHGRHLFNSTGPAQGGTRSAADEEDTRVVRYALQDLLEWFLSGNSLHGQPL